MTLPLGDIRLHTSLAQPSSLLPVSQPEAGSHTQGSNSQLGGLPSDNAVCSQRPLQPYSPGFGPFSFGSLRRWLILKTLSDNGSWNETRLEKVQLAGRKGGG